MIEKEQVLGAEIKSLPYDFNQTSFSIKKMPNEIEFDFRKADLNWNDRDKSETNFNCKQIIPYVLVKDSFNKELLVYERTGTEKRLHGLMSAGIGGHINLSDKGNTLEETIMNCAKREMEEELGVKISKDLEILGIINEQYSEVGKVHLGVVLLYYLDNRMNLNVGRELKNYRFVGNIEKEDLEFELWTKLALELL